MWNFIDLKRETWIANNKRLVNGPRSTVSYVKPLLLKLNEISSFSGHDLFITLRFKGENKSVIVLQNVDDNK